MHTLAQQLIMSAKAQADLAVLNEVADHVEDAVRLTHHSGMLGIGDDEMEPISGGYNEPHDPYYYAREVEPKQPQPLKDEPLLF